ESLHPPTLHLSSVSLSSVSPDTDPLCESSIPSNSPSARTMVAIPMTPNPRAVPRDVPHKDFSEEELRKVYDAQNLGLVLVFSALFFFLVIVVINRGTCGCKWNCFGRKTPANEEEMKEFTATSTSTSSDSGSSSRDPLPNQGFQPGQESGVQRLRPVHLALGSSFDEARSVLLDGPYYEVDLRDTSPSDSSPSPPRGPPKLNKCSIQ
ncbi:hypothetical protein QBC39DRAFT_62963, partial [Podospora conica]